MATAEILQYLETEADGQVRRAGSQTVPATMEYSGAILDTISTLADGYELALLWDASTSELLDFDFMWFRADGDNVLLCLVSGVDNIVVRIKGGIPFFESDNLVSDTLPTNGVEFTGDLKAVDKIYAFNNETGGAEKTIRLILGT
jgi:hypothetical protein